MLKSRGTPLNKKVAQDVIKLKGIQRKWKTLGTVADAISKQHNPQMPKEQRQLHTRTCSRKWVWVPEVRGRAADLKSAQHCPYCPVPRPPWRGRPLSLASGTLG